MQYAECFKGAEIKVIDDDHVLILHARTYSGAPKTGLTWEDLHLTRLSNCRFRLSGYSDGYIAELNFEGLSREYQTQWTGIIIPLS